MDCHYFDSWSVDTRNVCRSWLVLMRQLNIVVFGIFATFTVPFRLVLSVEHEPEIAGPTATATASTRHWQPGIFPLPLIKTVCFRHSDNRTTADSWKCSTSYHFTDLVSNRCMPTIFQSIVTTFVCTSTTFANAKWQSAGWSWWPVVPLFSEGIVSTVSPNYISFQSLTHGAGLQINADGNKSIQNWNYPIFLQVMYFPYSLPDKKYE